jgi:hypothetical protein
MMWIDPQDGRGRAGAVRAYGAADGAAAGQPVAGGGGAAGAVLAGEAAERARRRAHHQLRHPAPHGLPKEPAAVHPSKFLRRVHAALGQVQRVSTLVILI